MINAGQDIIFSTAGECVSCATLLFPTAYNVRGSKVMSNVLNASLLSKFIREFVQTVVQKYQNVLYAILGLLRPNVLLVQ